MVRTPRFHCYGVQVRSLVGELRSHMPRGMAKRIKNKKEEEEGRTGEGKALVKVFFRSGWKS